MTECFISLGAINKRLLLPFFLAVLEISYIIFNNYYKAKDNLVLQTLSMAFGEMSVKLLPCLLKINKDEFQGKDQLTKRQKIKHYAILMVLYLVNTGMIAAGTAYNFHVRGIDVNYAGSNLFPDIDLILMGFEMVFMILISFKLLNYKYYKHHIYSTIVFVLFGIISELCLETYFVKDPKFFYGQLIRLVGTVSDATYYCYQKYMMEKYYYPYWNIAFVPGVMHSFFAIILLIIILINKDKANSDQVFINTFYKFFTEGDLGLSVGKVVIIFVMHFIMCPLDILNIYYFSPNFIIIIFQFSRITKNLINSPASKLYCIIFYVIQFFALMVHLEIIELTFLGLNKYTKKNIDLRGIDDITLERKDSMLDKGSVDINEDYFVEKSANNDKAFEMKEQEEEAKN